MGTPLPLGPKSGQKYSVRPLKSIKRPVNISFFLLLCRILLFHCLNLLFVIWYKKKALNALIFLSLQRIAHDIFTKMAHSQKKFHIHNLRWQKVKKIVIFPEIPQLNKLETTLSWAQRSSAPTFSNMYFKYLLKGWFAVLMSLF